MEIFRPELNILTEAGTLLCEAYLVYQLPVGLFWARIQRNQLVEYYFSSKEPALVQLLHIVQKPFLVHNDLHIEYCLCHVCNVKYIVSFNSYFRSRVLQIELAESALQFLCPPYSLSPVATLSRRIGRTK